MPQKSSRRISSVARETEKRLKAAGVSRGRMPRTTRRIKRALVALAARAPDFAPVRKHSLFVKRLANELARQLQQYGVKVDRGLANQAALAHDSMRDVKDAYSDVASQVHWAQRGAPEIARAIPQGEYFSLKNYHLWPVEKRIVVFCDTVCRGVKAGNTFVNGILPSATAFRLLVSQRNADPKRIDGLIRERQAVLKFEAELRSKGIGIDAIIRRQMKRNPAGFLETVEKQIASADVNKFVMESMQRLGIKKLDY